LVDPEGPILNYLADNEPKRSKHASPLSISVEEGKKAIHGTIEVYKDIAEIEEYYFDKMLNEARSFTNGVQK
jgi:hypothetical protein